MPQTKPVPNQCLLVRPGHSIYETMMAAVPDLLPDYERARNVYFPRVDGMELGGDPCDSRNSSRQRYGRGPQSLDQYLRDNYGSGLSDIRQKT